MEHSVTQVFWRQPWGPPALESLRHILESLGLTLRDLPSQALDLHSGTVGGVPITACAFRAPAGPAWSCLHLPGGSSLGERLAEAVVQHTGQPALVVSEHQQTEWTFSLYSTSHPVQHFRSGTEAPHRESLCSALSEILQTSTEPFAFYLEPLPSDAEPDARAYPDDLFPLRNPWVRIDFLRAIGIIYPIPAQTQYGVFCLLRPPNAGDTDPSPRPFHQLPFAPLDPTLLRLN